MTFPSRAHSGCLLIAIVSLLVPASFSEAQGVARPRGERTTVYVVADEPWTPTGIYVREGEYLSFDARGEIQLSGDAADLARPAGTRPGDLARRGPMPQFLRGALIGRVGRSRPFGIGDQRQPLRMPASGELQLGINDDAFGDNLGEFEVIVQGGSVTPFGDSGGSEMRGVSVQANRHWTRTGILVQQGDLITFRAAGQIRLGSGRDDVARPAGSAEDRYDRYAPLPGALAGALIGRVGDGAPFGIGDQRQALRMPATGDLYLGINEDYVDDNSGQFTVSIRGGSPVPGGWPGQPGGPGPGLDLEPLARARVRADNPWTPSGLTVRSGEYLRFETSGRIRVDDGTTVGPEGGRAQADYAAAMPGAPVGALIARIEGGPAFVIGQTREAVRMPASGRLLLGVNDDFFPDNRGEFEVEILRDERWVR